MSQAAQHPHNVERRTFIDVAGTVQPAPAPRFSRTVAEVASPPAHAGAHTREVFEAWGVDTATIDAWADAGAIRQAG
jgi:alpha-methylacyl-CoA racemase